MGARSVTNQCHSASWFHTLCKCISIEPNRDATGNAIPDSYKIIDQGSLQDQAQNSSSWLRCAFYLKWDPARGSVNPHSDSSETSIRTTSNTVNESSERKCLTLICFNAPPQLINRFKRLLDNTEWRNVLQSPFDLWIVVIDELFARMDIQAWNLADVFRGIERVRNILTYFPR